MKKQTLNRIKFVSLISLVFILFCIPFVLADYKREIYDYQGSHTKEKVNYSLIDSDEFTGDNMTLSGNATASWFRGLFNWTLASDWTSDILSWTGSTLSFSSDEFNNTVIENIGYNRSFNTEFANITVKDGNYFKGQPLDGSLDSGIVWAAEFDGNANVNLTHTASSLNIVYPDMVVRVVNTTNDVKYCNITGTTATVTDEQHSVYYVDNDCVVQSTTIANYILTNLSPGGITEIFNTMAHSGDIEVHQGAPIQSKVNIKTRKAAFSVAHLRTISGMSINTEGFPNFTISTGSYVFINDIMDTTVQNMTNGSTFEVVYRDGGSWLYDNYFGTTQTGLNLTSCDDETDVVTCTNINRFRRYFIFITGFSDGDDETEVHQRLADEDTTYTNVGDCLDITSNPISYLIPAIYTYTAIPLYMYCGRAVDTVWTTNFIDLRTIQVGQAASEIDTSIFITKDGTRTFTGNQSLGGNSLLNVNYTCFNPDCSSRIYDNGSDLIVERL